jgi:hypothetical protein
VPIRAQPEADQSGSHVVEPQEQESDEQGLPWKSRSRNVHELEPEEENGGTRTVEVAESKSLRYRVSFDLVRGDFVK